MRYPEPNTGPRAAVHSRDRRTNADPVNGPSRATEFVGGAVTSPGIVDRAASTEAERIAAAAPADAAVLANNPHLAYANQAYKGYCIVEAGAGLDVRYLAVHEQLDPAPESSPCAASGSTQVSPSSSTRVVRCRGEPRRPSARALRRARPSARWADRW